MTDENQIEKHNLSKDERNWAAYCHLAALIGLVIPVIGNFLGPYIVWLQTKDQYPFVNEQGKEVFNFQITYLIMFIVSGLLSFVAFGKLLLFLLPFYWLVLTIIAAVKTSNGVNYRYPFTLRLI